MFRKNMDMAVLNAYEFGQVYDTDAWIFAILEFCITILWEMVAICTCATVEHVIQAVQVRLGAG